MKKIYQFIFGSEMQIRERLLRMVLIVGGIMVLFGVAECLILVDFNYVNLPLFLLIITIVVSLITIVRFQKADLAAVLLGVVCIVVVFPSMFIFSGGINGGAPLWLAVGFIYSFIMFYGRRLKLFLALCTVTNVILYWVAYHHENLVYRLSGSVNEYLDSLFSVLVVGVGIGAIIRFQITLFEKERALNLLQKEELEKANSAQNAFFASMSHEIRTPINTIIGLNEMILRSKPSAEVLDYAGDVQVASKMLLSLINDVLDITQIEMDKMELVPVEYSTKELFGDLIDVIQVQMKAKKLQLLVDIDRNFPSALMGDEKRIKQVLLNILSNAVKYTPSGSVTLSARAETIDAENVIMRIAVADTGMGIKKEDLQDLYDSFKRVDTQKNRQIEGSGLGLAITKQLVDLMHGEIKVDSIYTKGSTFTVILEQKVANHTPIGRVDFLKSGRHHSRYEYHQSFEAPEARILIVDDNRMNTVVESRLLAATKVQVDVAQSGEECLELAKQKHYHVILMDYMMTGINGAETLLQLRKQENGLCRESSVIVLTANALEDARWLYETYQFDGYLEKPVTGRQLEEEIVKFIPQDIIEYQAQEENELGGENSIDIVSKRRSLKRLMITTDSVSDLPESILNKYDIGMMNLYIRTSTGRFADTEEIDSDSLARYVSTESSNIYADSATVQEFEEFFAEALTQADYVLHISMSGLCGKSYGIARQAAQGFDHVIVIDSGQISSGEGLIAMQAAQMVKDGYKVDELSSEIQKLKGRIRARYMMPSVNVFYQRGFSNGVAGKLYRVLKAHPVVAIKEEKVVINGVYFGDIERSWRRFIRYNLRFGNKIDRGLVVITHVGCTYRQQQFLREEVLKCIPFEKVLIHKASFSSAANTGYMSIGISYFLKE